jgi:hypothetical protein
MDAEVDADPGILRQQSCGCRQERRVSGDVLFRGSVGRTDLRAATRPLFQTVPDKLFACPRDVRLSRPRTRGRPSSTSAEQPFVGVNAPWPN